jgi:site-specific DNA recombinase
MTRAEASRKRCAIYTRKSSEEGLEQEFNSLAAQCEACEAFIRSQRNEGWVLVRTRYDDGGFSGGNLERPALQRLVADIRAGRIDIVVVYKVDGSHRGTVFACRSCGPFRSRPPGRFRRPLRQAI